MSEIKRNILTLEIMTNDKRIRFINPLSAGIFTDFGFWLIEGRVLHKGAYGSRL